MAVINIAKQRINDKNFDYKQANIKCVNQILNFSFLPIGNLLIPKPVWLPDKAFWFLAEGCLVGKTWNKNIFLLGLW